MALKVMECYSFRCLVVDILLVDIEAYSTSTLLHNSFKSIISATLPNVGDKQMKWLIFLNVVNKSRILTCWIKRCLMKDGLIFLLVKIQKKETISDRIDKVIVFLTVI